MNKSTVLESLEWYFLLSLSLGCLIFYNYIKGILSMILEIELVVESLDSD